MTVSKELRPWFRADVVFKLIADGTTTKTISFVSREPIVGSTSYWPLLKSESGLGQEIDQSGLPAGENGTVVLKDKPGSFGTDRRIVDLLQRYTVNDQPISLYWAQVGADIDTVPSSWTLYWKGKIASWDKSCTGEHELSLSTQTTPLSTDLLGMVIDETFAPSGYTVPDSSLGKNLPVPFTNNPPGGTYSDSVYTDRVFLPAFPVKTGGANNDTGIYAYCANLGGFDVFQGAPVFAKHLSGLYANISTTVSGLISGSSLGAAVTSHGKTEFLVKFLGTQYPGVVCNASWQCKGQSNAGITPTGDIIFTLYTKPKNNNSAGTGWTAVSQATVAKSGYLSNVRGGSDFTVQATFAKPYVFDSTQEEIALGIVQRDYSSSTTDFTSANSFSGTYYTRTTDNTSNGWLSVSAGVPNTTIGFATATFGFTGVNDRGYKAAQLTYLSPSSGCDVTALDLMVGTYGLRGGTLVAGPDTSEIHSPQAVLDLVTRNWNGSVWAASSDMDFTTHNSAYSAFASGNYLRRVQGFLEGSQSVEQIVSMIVKEMACYLVPLTNGKLGLLPWGVRLPVTKWFTDENCSVLSYRSLDTSAIVNIVRLAYGRNYLDVDSKWIVDGDPANSQNVLVKSSSNTLFGNKTSSEATSTFIGDSITANTYASFLLARNNAPAQYIRIEVPFYDNSSIELMNIVDLQSVDLPAHFGSNYNAQPPTLSGNLIDIFKGRKTIRGERARCQIVGRHIDRSNEADPRLQLDLRILKPLHPDDPTADAVLLLGT